MNLKHLFVAGVCVATLTGCATTTTTPTLKDIAAAREEGLMGTSISGGACDGAGQMLPGQFSPGAVSRVNFESVSLEASAAPTHE